MLEDFAQAKRNLADIRRQLEQIKDNPAAINEAEFLKQRALDLLQYIYADSKLALEYIRRTFAEASIDEVLSTIDRSLLVTPPLRRALGSEEDGKTIQALVDAAVWKSRFVWLISWVTGTLIVITLAALGYTVVDLNKQADKAREAISQARENAQDAVNKMNASIKEIDKNTAEIESQKKAIEANVAALEKRLGDPGDEIKRITLRFESELARLSELEQDWARRREAIGGALAVHATFLSGEEAKVTRQKTEFDELVLKQTAAIEPLVKNAQQLQSTLKTLVDTSKESTDSLSKQISATQTQLKTAEGVITTTETANQKLAAAQRQGDELNAKMTSASDGLDQKTTELKKAAEGYSQSIATTKQNFDDDAKKQKQNLQDTIADLKKAVETPADQAKQTAENAMKALISQQTSAGQYVDTIRQIHDAATEQSTKTAQLLVSSSALQSSITEKLRDIEREDQQLKNERGQAKKELDQIRDIISVVEDKRTDILNKLHTMLDQQPGFDSAAVWKLILASNVLIVLTGLVALLLLVLILVLLFGRRRLNLAAPQVP